MNDWSVDDRIVRSKWEVLTLLKLLLKLHVNILVTQPPFGRVWLSEVVNFSFEGKMGFHRRRLDQLSLQWCIRLHKFLRWLIIIKSKVETQTETTF